MPVKITVHSGAAEACEANGDFEKAAKIWESLDYFDKAFENWERVGKAEGAKARAREKAEEYGADARWSRAAFVWDQLGDYRRAGKSWERAGNWLRAIDSWKRTGDQERLAAAHEQARKRARKYETDNSWFWAAKYWENLGEWTQAALAWEKDGRHAEAAVCWERSGKWIEASANWGRIGDARAEKDMGRARSDALEFEGRKLFLKAGRIWAALGEWERAAKNFEADRAWLEASRAWRKAGKAESTKKAEEMGKAQLRKRRVHFLEERWGDVGDIGRASKSWSKSEWRGMAGKYEDEQNFLDAAHCYTEAEEWEKAGELWEKVGELIEARNCWQSASMLEKVGALEKKIRDNALLDEKNCEWKKAAKQWEALNEWARAAAAWAKIGEDGLEEEAIKNAAIKNEIYGHWYEAALERKEIGDYQKAINDFERSHVSKKPDEREFYKDIILEADVLGTLNIRDRHDWIAYSYLVKGAMGDIHALKKILEMEPKGAPYVLHWLDECYRLAAHWSGNLDSCKEFTYNLVEELKKCFSKVLLKETKIRCLEYIISAYQSLFVIGDELDDGETIRRAVAALRDYVGAYVKITSSENLTDDSLRSLIAFYFLEEKWGKVKKLCEIGDNKFGGDFYRLCSGLAKSLESARDMEAASLMYFYSFRIPKSAQDTKDAFLKGMWIPKTFLNSPEYIVGRVAEQKAELKKELKEGFRELLERADKKFKDDDYEGAAGLYEEFLKFPLTVGLEARVLKNLVKCASELKRDKDKRRFGSELLRIS